MTNFYDGTEYLNEVSNLRVGQAVVYKGTALPTGAANYVPQYGFFCLVDSLSAPTTRTWYVQTSATISSPSFSQIPDPTGQTTDQVYPLNVTIGDYTTPSSATASSSEGPTQLLSDSFGSDSWTDSGAGIGVSGGTLVWDGVRDNANGASHIDLGATNPPNVSFRVRFKLVISAISGGSTDSSHYVFFGLSSTTGASASGTTRDFIGLALKRRVNGTNAFYAIDGDGIAWDDSGATTSPDATFTTVPSATTYYVQIDRTSSTAYTISIYSDSSYTTLTESQSGTCASTCQTLRYVLVQRYNASTVATSFNGYIDDLLVYDSNATNYPATNAYDGSTSSKWKSTSSANPNIYFDMGSAKDPASIAINFDKTTNTETEIQIAFSTDTSFTSPEIVRTMLLTNFTDDTWRFISFNRLQEDKRYFRIYGSSGATCVMAINEVKYYVPTDYDRKHFHKYLNPTSTSATSLDSN